MATDQHKTAIITGGLSGIGLAAACSLLRRGVNVAAVSSRASHDRYQSARDLLAETAEAHHRDIMVLDLDIRAPDSISQNIDTVSTQMGDISILVNAAGIYHHEAIAGHRLDHWDNSIAINLTGPFLMIRSCWPMMVKLGHGRVINIASTAAHYGMQDYASYCAAKSGLLGLTRVTALEGAPHSITCNSISPSWVDTPMMEESLKSQAQERGVDVDQLYQEARRANPQSRIITPDEIASQITWLALDAPMSLTGEDILMTGGAHW